MDTETSRRYCWGVIGLSCTPFDPLVDTETSAEDYDIYAAYGCTPFDPLVDTETLLNVQVSLFLIIVAPPSIRLWILKLF